MGPLKSIATALALTGAVPIRTETIADWRPYLVQASLRFGVPAEWIERVMQAESSGHTMLDGHPIRSRAGAIGLMQLMPATWDSMRQTLGLGSDPDDPRDNILAGTFYLRLLYDRYGYPGLFAAYNAGPGRYAIHLATGRALPRETIAYLRAVGGPIGSPRSQAAPPREMLFAVRHPVSPRSGTDVPPPPPASLFAVTHDGR